MTVCKICLQSAAHLLLFIGNDLINENSGQFGKIPDKPPVVEYPHVAARVNGHPYGDLPRFSPDAVETHLLIQDLKEVPDPDGGIVVTVGLCQVLVYLF